MEIDDLVAYSYEQGKRVLEKREINTLKEHGQFFTPPAVACYMAKQLGNIQNGAVVLEPACGSGVLVCALVERLIAEEIPLEISIIAYETDKDLAELSRQVFSLASQKAAKHNITLHWQVHQEDFILGCLPNEQPSLFGADELGHKPFDFVISNPPYFKLNTNDVRVKAVSGKLNGHTNIYTLFMALSTKLLAPQGKACFIVPRSFCSGAYFSEFRRDLLKDVVPISVHLFQSRNDVFKDNEVLQENVIFSFEKSARQEHRYWVGAVNISTSANETELNATISRQVSFNHFLSNRNGFPFFRLPTGILDEQILDAIDRWDGSLEKYGLLVSTGKVVPFRAKSFLRQLPQKENGMAPLLWMQNVKPYQVEFPLDRFEKPQAILANDPSLLVPCSNYVLLRRFSAKEDRRRLVAAPFLGDQFEYEEIGFENHLNVISKKGVLSEYEAIGLAAILNSAIMDRYVRIVNGNTQVNATEIRVLPLPPLEVIIELGKKIESILNPTSEEIDKIIFSTLWKTNLLAEEFPIIQETRLTMGKIEQAQEILESLGLPSAQQNEISALTLLALAQLSERSAWKNAANPMLRVHDILVEIKHRYGREYAENSRETIRRRVLHQFEQAGIVMQNADDPARPTNSGLNNYMLSDLALDAVRAYRSPAWDGKRKAFLDQQGSLLELYQQSREQTQIPLQVADGTTYKLSPGKHNQLQSAIISEFSSRFAPGARLLYLGDTAKKTIVFEQDLLEKLHVPVSKHGKLADIILYDDKKNLLFLIEAVTAHGPVSPKRHVELERLLQKCTAERVYITAFLDFATFKKFSDEIAWETEVWIAAIPSHMIHFNGEKFLRPG